MSTPLSRRGFLRGLSLTGVAAALHSLSGTAMGARQHPEPMTETRLLMGTLVKISVVDASRARCEEGLNKAFARVEALLPFFDRHDSSSALSVLNAQGSLKDVPCELSELLVRSRSVSVLTGGAFNPTVLPLVTTFQHYANPVGMTEIPAEELAGARELISRDGLSGWHCDAQGAELERSGMGLTLDAVAKGRIADLVSAELLQLGLKNHLIDAGGDLIARGEKAPGLPWRVAVANPLTPHSGLQRHGQAFPLCNMALATSGSYEIYYDAEHRYHHLIQAADGTSASGVISASVLAGDAAEADALATSFAVMGAQKAVRMAESLPNCECLLLGSDGRVFKSKGWPV